MILAILQKHPPALHLNLHGAGLEIEYLNLRIARIDGLIFQRCKLLTPALRRAQIGYALPLA
jgi:hypothetical protein